MVSSYTLKYILINRSPRISRLVHKEISPRISISCTVLVAFKAGQKLATHTAPAELMINVIEGEIEFTMLDKVHTIKGGEFLLMGADVTHSVLAKTDSKMMLIKVKP